MSWIALVGPILALTAGALIAFWPRIVSWVQGHLIHNFPRYADQFRQALAAVDRLASPARQAALAAWRALRERFHLILVSFTKNFQGQWLRKIESYFATDVAGRYELTTTTAIVDYSELPAELRHADLLDEEASNRIDFTKAQDMRLLELLA